MNTLVIIPCGKKKIWDRYPYVGPTKAKDVYISGYFRWNRRYAEKFGDKWVILSAKYGFIDSDFIISENYDVSFTDRSTETVSLNKLKRQVSDMKLMDFDTIIFLGGKVYADIVSKAFEDYNVEIIKPFTGLKLGEYMSKVKEAVTTGNPSL